MKCRHRRVSAQLKDAYPQSRLRQKRYLIEARRVILKRGSEDGEDVHSKSWARRPRNHGLRDYATPKQSGNREGVKLQSGCRVLFELGQEIPQASRNDFRRTDAAKKVKSGPATLFVVVWRLTEDS